MSLKVTDSTTLPLLFPKRFKKVAHFGGIAGGTVVANHGPGRGCPAFRGVLVGGMLKMNGKSSKIARQRGFTITQMVITIAIISVISMFGVLGIKNARAEFRLQNNARLFATHVEKARVDAIRRHAA